MFVKDSKGILMTGHMAALCDSMKQNVMDQGCFEATAFSCYKWKPSELFQNLKSSVLCLSLSCGTANPTF